MMKRGYRMIPYNMVCVLDNSDVPPLTVVGGRVRIIPG